MHIAISKPPETINGGAVPRMEYLSVPLEQRRSLLRFAGTARGQSVDFMRGLLTGAYWPMVPPVGMAFVDVDDVAAAHILAMATPAAKGRYALR